MHVRAWAVVVLFRCSVCQEFVGSASAALSEVGLVLAVTLVLRHPLWWFRLRARRLRLGYTSTLGTTCATAVSASGGDDVVLGYDTGFKSAPASARGHLTPATLTTLVGWRLRCPPGLTLTSSPTSGRLWLLLVVVRCYYEDRCLDDDLVLSFALKSAL